MRSLLLVLLLTTPVSPDVHDFFISILTIRHNTEEQQLHLTWRMTSHDVEHALSPEVQGRQLHLGTDLELAEADGLLRQYILENIEIEIDGEPVRVEFLGREVEAEDLYCYLYVEEVKEFDRITVHSTLLFDMFEEQENVVHLETGTGTLTHSFRNNSAPFTFSLRP